MEEAKEAAITNFDNLRSSLELLVICAGVGNLSQSILWLGVIILLKKTSL
jgi:hypothetical protein